MGPLEVDFLNSFFLLAVNRSLSSYSYCQKNRQVKSSLRPGKKDIDSPDSPGFEPSTSRSNT